MQTHRCPHSGPGPWLESACAMGTRGGSPSPGAEIVQKAFIEAFNVPGRPPGTCCPEMKEV